MPAGSVLQAASNVEIYHKKSVAGDLIVSGENNNAIDCPVFNIEPVYETNFLTNCVVFLLFYPSFF